jgi:hypothetical protein
MSDAVRYRAAPFHALRGRQGNKVVSSPLSGERRVMPDGAFTLLDHLRAFRTLSEHAEYAVRRMGTAQGREADVKRTLEDLRRQGLLISEEEFFRLALPEVARGSPISTIAIPTSGRTGLVERCIESYTAHARKFGHSVKFVIAGADRRRLEEWTLAMGEAGVDPAVARFALLGEVAGLPPGIARTTGANRNALLLECAGEAFLSVDDDTLCRFARSPASLDGLAIYSTGNPLEMWFGPDLPVPSEAADLDFLAEVGRSLGPAIRSAASLSTADLNHSTLEKLCRGSARARLVQIGLMGDAATDSPEGWLVSTGPTRERLVSTEGGYRAAMASRRVFSAAPSEAIAASRQLMAYCIALDHREELPPFPPLGRDQDGVFAAWERIVEPDSFTVHLPFAVAHEPPEIRGFPPGEPRPSPGMPFNEVLYLLCDDADPGPANCTPADRMRWLGRRLEEIAGLSRAGFEAFLLERRLSSISRRIVYFETALKQFGSKPAWWVRDMQRFVRCWEEEMTSPEVLRFAEPGANAPDALDDPLGVRQHYVRWCGRLLREWPAMREAALRLRHEK